MTARAQSSGHVEEGAGLYCPIPALDWSVPGRGLAAVVTRKEIGADNNKLLCCNRAEIRGRRMHRLQTKKSLRLPSPGWPFTINQVYGGHTRFDK